MVNPVRTAKMSESRGAPLFWNEERKSASYVPAKPAVPSKPSVKVMQERKTGRKMPAAREQRLRRLEASTRELLHKRDQVQEDLHCLQISSEELHLDIDSLKSNYEQLAEDVGQHLRMGRYHRLVLHADKAAVRLQALQEHGRERALASVGISRDAIAEDNRPWGDRIITLVQDWDRACWDCLTEEDLKAVTKQFGPRFMSFIEKDALIMMEMPHASRPAYTLSIDMPLAEKAYIMEAIDNLPPEKREGGRSAFLAFIGSRAPWEYVLDRVYHELGASGCGDKQARPAHK
ncbi:g6209 [Coccomyxa viridis]|uniref:G6209 protein n=1 Tax=Coccomyxa viridis TaxID=1274662 RepID=A0ABP1FZP6_9CHLO